MTTPAAELKHWITGNTQLGHGPAGLILKDGYMNKVLSVRIFNDGDVQFVEECDGCFGSIKTSEDALETIDELRSWLVSQLEKLETQSYRRR